MGLAFAAPATGINRANNAKVIFTRPGYRRQFSVGCGQRTPAGNAGMAGLWRGKSGLQEDVPVIGPQGAFSLVDA